MNALPCLNIYSLKIENNKDKRLKFFSGSEISSISNIKSLVSIHTTLIFKEQAKVKNVGEKGLAQPHYSIQHIEGKNLLCYKERSTFLNDCD
jgi:hypothetical protein